MGACRLGHLDGRHADAAGRPVDQQRLASLQRATLEHIGEDGEDGFRQHGSLFEIQTLGDRQDVTGVDHGQLRIAPAAQKGADPVAYSPARHALSDGLDLAGDLKPQNVRCAKRRGVGAGALQQVGPVHTRRPHPDQHLTRPRHGIGPFGDLQGLC